MVQKSAFISIYGLISRHYLIKEYGRKFDDIMANLQSGSEKMLTHAMDIPFEEGDSIERTLPNGVTETYVIDAQ